METNIELEQRPPSRLRETLPEQRARQIKRGHLKALTGLDDDQLKRLSVACQVIKRMAVLKAKPTDRADRNRVEHEAALGIRSYILTLTAADQRQADQERKKREGDDIAANKWWQTLGLTGLEAAFVNMVHQQSWTGEARIVAEKYTDERHTVPAAEEGDPPSKWPYLLLLVPKTGAAIYKAKGISRPTVWRYAEHMAEEGVWPKIPIKRGRGIRYAYAVGYRRSGDGHRWTSVYFIKDSAKVRGALKRLRQLSFHKKR